MKALPAMSVTLVAFAFVVRVIAPRTTWFVPWGRPLGRHYVRMASLAFWVLLIVGLLMGLIAMVKITR